MNKDEVLKLANLSRIHLSDTEAENLRHEFESILGYVSEVSKIRPTETQVSREDLPVRGVFRDDKRFHESGIYTEALLQNAPGRFGQYFKVKKIL